ncbi:MAG TPA: NAD(P)H-dependent oxidoreductase subunit E [Gemmatimonadaceae bacterium]|nr:NAD(P)H-dependent oxidoreductase subunit E [Gemmatimonadaceae bacterium]
MDLHLLDAEPTAEEREAIDALLGAPESTWEGGARTARDDHTAALGRAARERRHLLLPAFHAVQSRAGWISEGALNYIAARLTVPPAEAYGVATFYGLLSMVPRPRRVLHVCDDIACRAKGAAELCARLEQTAGAAYHHGPDGDAHAIPEDGAVWLRSPCLGLCEQAPAALVTVAGEAPMERLFGNVTVERAARVLQGDLSASEEARPRIPQAGDPALRLLRRVDVTDPADLDDYRAHGGYQALRQAVTLGPDGVIREVTDARLMGRGGAAFPTGRKWDAVARQPVRPHYLVCNADESEPGTFKDRVLMEGDPFGVIEAMTVAAYATGCERGYIYLRGEYPLARERLQHAIDVARARGLLGDDVGGYGFRFDVEIRQGAGAYICGEETAIFNSIEGYRGEPRNKPPFPVQAGLFGKPTVVNNVETLANVLEILRIGGPAYASIGTEGSTGTRLFCLSGNVSRPGVYEVPFGVTLREMIAMAGGVADGRAVQAVLLGGAAGVFVRPDELDIPLTFEGARAARATLGSGVIMVFDDRAPMLDILLRIAAFFRDESCGQCVPCRVGTVRQEEALHRLSVGKARGGVREEVALLEEIGVAMRDASICGLGQTAYSAVESAIARLGLLNGARTR